jgi:DNA-binding transcriptional LysR family regulator
MSLRLDPLSLKLFVSVTELHSIAAAAAAAHLAPAAVSKRLSELEHQLGTTLLLRTNKGVQPTPAGHALVNLARRLLLDLEDIAVQMRDWSGGTRGHVRVVSNISAITQFLPREIAAFLQAWPDVEVHLQERISTAVVKAVLENEADLGICVHGDDMQGLEVLPYHDDELVLIVPEGHALARRKRVAFADTVAYPYVGLHTGSAINLALERASLEAQQPLHLRIQVTSFDALSRMVEAGLGIGLMPASFAQPLARSLAIRTVALTEPWTTRRLVLCMRSYAGLPTAARLLVDALREASSPAAPKPARRR